MNVLQYLWHYTLQMFGDDLLMTFILKHMPFEKIFNHVNNLHQNIKFTLEEEANGELAFLDTSLKWKNGKISVLIYRKTPNKFLGKSS